MNKQKISESIKNPIHEENNIILDAIFDQSNVMIAHMDTQFNFVRVSKAYAEADKKDIKFYIGKNHFDLYPNEENEQIFRNVVETGEPYYVKAKDFKYAEHLDWGVTSWDWSLIPIKKPNGDVKSLVLTIFNVTAQKKIEEEFLKEKEFMETALNAQRDTFFVFDPSTGKVVRWNKAFKEISGYSDEEMSVLKAPETYYREDELKQLVIATEVIEQGGTTTNELNLITKEGNLIPFEYVASGIFDDEANLKYIVAIGRDITERKKVERKLRESEEKFRTIAEESMVGISIIQDDVIKYINQRFLDNIDYTLEEIQNWKPGELFERLVVPEQREEIRDISHKNQLGKTKYTTNKELKLIRKNGDIRWIEFHARSIIYQGRPAGMNVSIDISERKKAEQKLKESEEKFRTITEESFLAISILQDNVVKYTNQRMADLMGYSIEEILNWEPGGFIKVVAPDYLEIVREQVKKKQLGDPDVIVHYPIQAVKKSGELFWIDNISKTIMFEGRAADLVTEIDITERKMAEQKLKESEERYRIIFEFSPVGIGISDLEGNIYSINQAMEEITGYDAESAKETNLKSIYADPDDRLKLLKKIKEAGKIQDYLVKFRKKDGSIYDALLNIEPTNIANKNFFISTVQDISERKKVEKKLKELNKLKSELLTRTSHELKTPAMHIKGYVDLLLHKYKNHLGSDELQIISTIKKGVLRLETLIYDILHKAELDSGTGELNKVKDNLASLIDLSVRELRSFAALRGHSITLDIHDSLIIIFDNEQIRHVLNNLITNAIKYTPLNGIIRINSTITDDFITIAIQDNGIGLTEEQIHRLFTQFGKIERHGQGYDIITEGTGLGLHIAKKIIDLHDGKLWVESGGRNKGSTFYFSLPKGEES